MMIICRAEDFTKIYKHKIQVLLSIGRRKKKITAWGMSVNKQASNKVYKTSNFYVGYIQTSLTASKRKASSHS